MVELSKANSYLSKHMFNKKWTDADEPKQTSALNTAESILTSQFKLRDGYELTDNWLHAVSEQALHLLNFAKERYQLQQEGVSYYVMEGGIAITMTNGLISQVAKGFLKPIIKLHVGDAK